MESYGCFWILAQHRKNVLPLREMFEKVLHCGFLQKIYKQFGEIRVLY